MTECAIAFQQKDNLHVKKRSYYSYSSRLEVSIQLAEEAVLRCGACRVLRS